MAKQQRLIALLEEKRQAVISHAVTKGLDPTAPLRPSGIDWLGDVPAHWEVCRIKHLAHTIAKGTTPSTVGGELTASGVRFMKAENIGKSLAVSTLPKFYISALMDEQISRSRLCANDVLVIIAGATTGLASVISADLLPATTNQAVSFIRPKEPEHAFYILHWLSTEFAQRTIWLGAVQAAQPNLSMESLGNIPVALPPPDEMRAILSAISESHQRFAGLLDKAQSAITLLKERRTALISAAVTGKIDVRDWQAPAAISTQDISQDA
jgi:type I restriction enzyme S subunit